MAGRGGGKRKRDPERERFWRRTMKAWARSGTTIRGFCAEHGLTETSFHAWRRELKQRDGERHRSTNRPANARRVTARQGAPRRASFVPVRMTAIAAPVEIERDGTTIRLHGEVDVGLLARVLEALGRSPC